jgi:hypothetical protein
VTRGHIELEPRGYAGLSSSTYSYSGGDATGGSDEAKRFKTGSDEAKRFKTG